MEIEIKKVGNSKGIILPKQIAQEMDLNFGTKLQLTLAANGDLILSNNNPREGWEEQIIQCLELYGPPDPPIDIQDDPFDLNEWEWPADILENIPEEGYIATLIEEDDNRDRKKQ